jgi:hypothetical protein
VAGAGPGSYTAYRNNPAAPYDAPAAVGSATFGAAPTLRLELPPMTVTVLVVTPGGSTAPAPPATTPATTAPPAPTTTAPSVSVPGAPTGLSVARSADGATATVTWKPPASTGGGTVSGYRVARDGTDTTGGAAYATTVTAATRTFTFTLLRPDATYTFSVQAINSAGSSVAATILSGPAPTSPVGLTATSPGDPTRVTVSWQPPASTGGLPITGYRVARDGTDTTGGGAYATTRPAGDRSFTFTLLRRSTTYTFTVAAITSAGQQPAATVRFTTS